MRSRAVPAATVGGRIAGTQMPVSSSDSIRRTAAALSPTISGWIGVSDGASDHGRSRRPRRRRATCSRSRARRQSSRSTMRRLSTSAAASAGGEPVVNT